MFFSVLYELSKLSMKDSKTSDKNEVKLLSFSQLVERVHQNTRQMSNLELLAQINHLLNKKYSQINELDEVEMELNIFRVYQVWKKTSLEDVEEFTTALSILTVLIISKIELTGDIFSKEYNVLIDLQNLINDENLSAKIKKSVVDSFGAIQLILLQGSKPIDLNLTINWLLELLPIDDLECLVSVVTAAGSLMTLLAEFSSEFKNEFIQDVLIKLVELLNDHSDDLRKSSAVCSLISLCYEMFDYGDGTGGEGEDAQVPEEPYYDAHEITAILQNLISPSSKKFSKNEKKDSRNIFRDCLLTIDHYTETESSDEHTEFSEMVLYSLKINKSKNLQLSTWFGYFRYLTLKQSLGQELMIKVICSNPSLVRLFTPPSVIPNKFQSDSEVELVHAAKDASSTTASDKKTQNSVRTARTHKIDLQTELNGLSL